MIRLIAHDKRHTRGGRHDEAHQTPDTRSEMHAREIGREAESREQEVAGDRGGRAGVLIKNYKNLLSLLVPEGAFQSSILSLLR